MPIIEEEYRDFIISTPSQRVLGTIFPVYATVKNKSGFPQLAKLLKKRSGDLVEGSSPHEAMENAKRYVDELAAGR
jgi:hypothetical protein